MKNNLFVGVKDGIVVAAAVDYENAEDDADIVDWVRRGYQVFYGDYDYVAVGKRWLPAIPKYPLPDIPILELNNLPTDTVGIIGANGTGAIIRAINTEANNG